MCKKILPNEKFTGKGHAAHICKKCARKAKARKSEDTAITRIYSALSCQNLSRDDREMLEKYARSGRKSIRTRALTVLAAFTKYPPLCKIERMEKEVPDEEIGDDVLE